MFRLTSFALALTLTTAAATSAQQAFECDWQARADTIVEPWEDNSRTFANGDVRLAVLDTIEPAAGAFHILVLSPPYDELGGRQCRTLSMDDGIGFSGVDFSSLQAGYDPAVGLVFEVNVRRFLPDSDSFGDALLTFTLNQATGTIGTDLQ